MVIKSYSDLEVWKISMEFAKSIYGITAKFPKEEMYGLGQQLRRAAVSIPSNIAEGSGRRSRQEFARFVNIANGSACEIETQILLAVSLSYVTENDYDILFEKSTRIRKMLYSLHKSLTNIQAPSTNNQVPNSEYATTE
jgi:four helix bundle protein